MPDVSTAQKDRLMSDLRVVIADAEELLRSTAGEVSGSAAEARGRIEARLQQAKANLAQLQDAALAKARAAGHAADEFVHENPWKAIGAAAGVGLVVGLLIGRR
jgi:ElaB/YqjD/DUF883 family membrane-anchored ribosome-binding protein